MDEPNPKRTKISINSEVITSVIGDPDLLDDIIKEDPDKLYFIYQNLPDHAVEIKLKMSKLDNDLYSMWDIIEAIEQYEITYLESAEENGKNDENEPSSIASDLPDIQNYNQNYFSTKQSNIRLEPGLIDVYKWYHRFVLEPLTQEEVKTAYLQLSDQPPKTFSLKAQEKVASLPPKHEFLRRFLIFTNDQLEGWNEWENMVVVGCAVVNCLLEIPSEYNGKEKGYYNDIAYKSSDIDIYLFGLTPSEFSNKLWRFYKFLLEKHKNKGREKVLIFKTPHTITFTTQYPDRHIQFVLGTWETIENILFEPDVDCSCFAYQGGNDGGTVFTTQRGMWSMNHRCIITSPVRYPVRGFPEYESRLVKYSKRGFIIRDKLLNWSKVSEHYINKGKVILAEHQSCKARICIVGLRLLILLHKFKDLMKDTDIFTVLSGDTIPSHEHLIDGLCIPYGPTWSMVAIENAYSKGMLHVTSNYGSAHVTLKPSKVTLLENISNAAELFVPHGDKLIAHINSGVDGWGYDPDDLFSSGNWYEYVFDSQFTDEIVEKKNELRSDEYAEDYMTNSLANLYDYDLIKRWNTYWEVVLGTASEQV